MAEAGASIRRSSGVTSRLVPDGRPQSSALFGAHRADRVRLRALLRRQRTTRRRRARTRATGEPGARPRRPRATAARRRTPRRSARPTRSRPATRLRGSPRRPASTSRRCTSSTPSSTRQRSRPVQKIRLDRVRRRAAAALAAAATLLLIANPAPARHADCPDSVGARAAIVIEVSTGIVACQRQADKRLAHRLDHEADDRAGDARERQALARRSRPRTTTPLPIESKIGLQPGERMKVSDLMRGLLLESGNDAAVDARRGRVRLPQDVRARDEPPRAPARSSKNTHFANPIGLDQEGNYSSARDLVTLATVLRTNTFFKKIVDSPVGHAQDRRPRSARSATATGSSPATAGSTASRPATRAARATCSSARAAAAASSSSPRCSARRARRRATTTRWRC